LGGGRSFSSVGGTLTGTPWKLYQSEVLLDMQVQWYTNFE